MSLTKATGIENPDLDGKAVRYVLERRRRLPR